MDTAGHGFGNASIDKNGCYLAIIQTIYTCMVCLSRIKWAYRRYKQQDESAKKQIYGSGNDEFFTLKLYALHGKRLRI